MAVTHRECTCKKLGLTNHCHHLLLTEIPQNQSKNRAKKVILFISSFEADSAITKVLMTDIPLAELNIFCFITASPGY